MRDLPAVLAPAVRAVWRGGAHLGARRSLGPALADEPVTALGERCRDLCRTRPGAMRQYSPTTCGTNALAMFRVLTDPDFAAQVPSGPELPRWWSDLEQRLQTATNSARHGLPWPAAFGTLPWSLAVQLTALARRRFTVRRVDPLDPATTRAAVLAADLSCRAGLPVALYVGNDRLPRHVTLLLAVHPGADRVEVYDPGVGAVVEVPLSRLGDGEPRISGWGRVWCLVTPP